MAARPYFSRRYVYRYDNNGAYNEAFAKILCGQTTLSGRAQRIHRRIVFGRETIKLSEAERQVNKAFDKLNIDVYNANWKSQFLSGIMQPLMSVISNVAYVAVCVVGSILAVNGKINFGVIVSFILYVRLFTSPLTQIAQGLTNLQTASPRRAEYSTF